MAAESKVLKNTINFVKKYPAVPFSAGTLAVSTANLATNQNRSKEAKRQTEMQVSAMNRLTKELTGFNAALSNADSLKIDKGSNGLLQKIKPVMKRKEKSNKRKSFSIKDGGYKGKKDAPTFRKSAKNVAGSTAVHGALGALLGSGIGYVTNGGQGAINAAKRGAILGSTLGATIGIFIDSIGRSVFKRDSSKSISNDDLIKYMSYYIDNDTRYIVLDKSHKDYLVTALQKGGVATFIINKPTNKELDELSEVLDDYCRGYKNADYTSREIEGNVWVVEMKMVDGAEPELFASLANKSKPLNLITKVPQNIK